MKRPTFFNGVLAALVLAFLASVAFATLMPFFGLGFVVRTLIPALGLLYIAYLFTRSPERTGRITTLMLWCVLAGASWLLAPPLPLYVLIHVGAVWLIRSLYFYSSVVPALIDLGLNALSVSTAIWAVSRSGSVFLAVWCFFLVQALFIAIPPALNRKARSGNTAPADDQKFQHARRRAEAALRQLFAQ